MESSNPFGNVHNGACGVMDAWMWGDTAVCVCVCVCVRPEIVLTSILSFARRQGINLKIPVIPTPEKNATLILRIYNVT